MGEGSEQERRRGLRIKIKASVHSQVLAMLEARLVDLSAGGALLEHVEPVRPGGACELLIEDNPEDMRLRCRIVRSTLTQPAQAEASREIRYHTGVEFVDLNPEQRAFLGALIQRYCNGGGGRALAVLAVVLLLL